MSRKDTYHDIVRRALQKDNWIITDDPLVIPAGRRKVKIDLGAEKLIGAEKEGRKIAIEIKSFLNLSQLHDFYGALGQFKFYYFALNKKESDRVLFLAVPDTIYEEFFDDAYIQEFIEFENVKVVIFNILKEIIVKWIE